MPTGKYKVMPEELAQAYAEEQRKNMAGIDFGHMGHIEVTLSEELKAALAETQEELRSAKETLSEDRIRAIVREELAAWEKRIRIATAHSWGPMEAKHAPRPRIDPKLIGEG